MSEEDLPHHPALDRLTAAERRVVTLARQGLVDAEIAVQLGLPISEVKVHVGAAMAKLGVGERPALRTWDPATAPAPPPAVEGAPAAPPAVRHEPGREDAPAMAAFDDESPWRLPGPAVAALSVLALVLLILGWSALSSGGEEAVEPRAARPATPSPTPAPTLAPVVVGGIEAVPVQFGRHYDLAEYVMLAEVGCTGCDLPPETLVRVTRRAGERPHVEELFRSPHPPPARATSFAVDREGWRVAATVCLEACDRLREPGAGRTALYLSEDGGVTWREELTLEGHVRAELYGAEGLLLSGPLDPRQPGRRGYWFHSTSVPATQDPALRPVGRLADGAVAWAKEGDASIYRSDGSLELALALGSGTIAWVEPLAGRRTFVAWIDTSTVPTRTFNGVVDPGGRLELAIAGAPAWPAIAIAPWHVLQVTAIPGAYVPGEFREPLSATPIVVDLAKGTFRPVPNAHTLQPEYQMAVHVIRFYREGPWVRLQGEEGTCVPVRRGPHTDGEVAACFAPGVVLPLEGTPTTQPGSTPGVRWPEGVGWVEPEHVAP